MPKPVLQLRNRLFEMTMHRHFCTYFDHRYLSRGLALHASLTRTCPEFTLWVLALSEEAVAYLTKASLPNLRVLPLTELETADAQLRDVRATRSLVEYYFTCSPCVLRHIFGSQSDINELTYLDSDLYFFSSPEPVFDEMGEASVGIIPHGFSQKAATSHARFGKYNVGWLTFRRTPEGIACLDWWRERCLEWCFDRVEDDRYADQKYLDRFEALFEGVHSISHPGANLAPWNVATRTVADAGGAVTVNGHLLVFFHFQGLRALSSHLYDSNLSGYGAHLNGPLRRNVFRTYIAALQAAERTVDNGDAARQPANRIRRAARGWKGLRYDAGRALRSIRAALSGNLIRV